MGWEPDKTPIPFASKLHLLAHESDADQITFYVVGAASIQPYAISRAEIRLPSNALHLLAWLDKVKPTSLGYFTLNPAVAIKRDKLPVNAVEAIRLPFKP